MAPSRSRKLIFYGIALLLLGGVFEGLAYLGASALQGRRFSWSALQAQRSAVLGQGPDAEAGASQPAREVNHPYLGYTRNPDRVDGVSALGYPDSTPLFTTRSDDRRIVAVVGGSVAFHFAKKGMPTVIETLKRHPRFADIEFVVANLAVGGYKQPQQLMTLNYLLALGFEFDFVINIDGFNEVALHQAENGPKGVFPIYPRAWYGRSSGASSARLRALAGRAAFEQERVEAWARRFSRFPLRYSVVANLIWKWRHANLDHERLLASEAFRTQPPEAASYATTGPAGLLEGQDLQQHLAGIWQRSSLQMDRLSRANGIRYYHFLQPNQYVPGSKIFTTDELKNAFNEEHPYRPGAEKGYAALGPATRRLTAAGVAFVDLTRVFAAEKATIYIDDCCHFNELGNKIIGRRVAQAILEDHAADVSSLNARAH